MNSRVALFSLVLIVLLVTVYSLVGLVIAVGAVGWGLLALPFILIGAMPMRMLRRQARSNFVEEAVIHASYLSMGLVTYLIVFSLLKLLSDLALGDSSIINRATVVIASLVCVAWGTVRAFRGPRVKEVIVPLENVPANFAELTIAQVSDLHVGLTIGRRYVENVTKKVNALGADIIALTGDIGDGRVESLRNELASFAKLESKFGVFYVPGNHEYYWNAASWTTLLSELGVRVLMNAGHTLHVRGHDVLIAGVTDPAARDTGQGDGPDAKSAYACAPNAALKVLLSHRPGIAHAAAAVGFHLQLSGHTHAGQFFPWTLVTKFVHEYNLGLGKSGAMWVYVNPGTGSWGPLLRLGTTPEITLLRLMPVARGRQGGSVSIRHKAL